LGERWRKDPGAIAELADSIAKRGMLHPVVQDTRGKLVAGYRRLLAARKLGWQDVPVRVVEGLDATLAALQAGRAHPADQAAVADTPARGDLVM
jgi:ParB family chromosome partitioning protein